jgi:hypothetical protein
VEDGLKILLGSLEQVQALNLYCRPHPHWEGQKSVQASGSAMFPAFFAPAANGY